MVLFSVLDSTGQSCTRLLIVTVYFYASDNALAFRLAIIDSD